VRSGRPANGRRAIADDDAGSLATELLDIQGRRKGADRWSGLLESPDTSTSRLADTGIGKLQQSEER
jgi:hypothetical protein